MDIHYYEQKNIKRALIFFPSSFLVSLIAMTLFFRTGNPAIGLFTGITFAGSIFGFWSLVIAPIIGRWLYSNIMPQRQKEHLQRSFLFRFLLNIDRKGRIRDD